MKPVVLGATLIGVLWASSAYAAVPVKDAAILDRKQATATSFAALTPVQDQSKKMRKGVHCSVTTGKRASIEDPRQAPDAAGATRSIRAATGSDAPVQAGRSLAGFGADSQAFGAATAIEGGVAADQAMVTAATQIYEGLKGEIGQTGTINEAFDQNSQIRLQNGSGWNNAIGTANNLVQTLNQLGLMRNSDISRASSGLGGSGADRTGRRGSSCPAGTVGAGTEASPCIAVNSSCVGVRYGSTGASMCVTRRFRDSYGNVMVYLENVEASLPQTTSQMTEQELLELMGQYQQQ